MQSDSVFFAVGGGVAGSIVAARLSEKSCISVLVLEAGKVPPKVTDIPVAARSFIQTDIDWNYVTAPQENAALGHINQVLIFIWLQIIYCLKLSIF